MTRWISHGAGFLIVAGFLGATLWATSVQGQSAVRVVVEAVREAEVRETVTLVGTARASRRSTVASQVEGWVEEIFFEAGDLVDKDRALARLEDRALQIQLEGARAALAEARARLGQAQADLDRLSVLWDSRSIAEKALQDAQFESDARKQRVNVLRSQVENLKDKLNKKTIRAPFSAWVAEQHVEVGEWVDAGGAVATLVDLAEIHVEIPIPERYLPSLKVGDPVAVALDALPEKIVSGQIHSICPSGDPRARTFSVEVSVSNPNGLIRAGMLARATFAVGAPHEAVLVPKDALVLTGSTRAVFVVNDQKAHRVSVQVVAYHEDAAEVQGDINPGSLVVVIGNERLRDGQPVEATPKPSSSQNVDLQ
jgi:RND family efflux transporter MFP subunit